MLQFVDRHKYALTLLYLPVFLTWFFLLEGRPGGGEYVVYSPLDDRIPFREEFVFAYFAWFGYLLGFVGWLFTRGNLRTEFPRAAYLLLVGITACMLVYTFWPNTQPLRPDPYPRDNALTDVVRGLQGFDTPTNVCPSLHVYTSIVVNHCLQHSSALTGRRGRAVRLSSWVLLVLISASTVFLKQHSILDLVWAVVLFAAVWTFGRLGLRWRRGPAASPPPSPPTPPPTRLKVSDTPGNTERVGDL